MSLNWHSYVIVRVSFLCYCKVIKGVDFFLNISEYIKSKKEFGLMPFMTVYLTITELIKDGYLEYDGEQLIKKDV